MILHSIFPVIIFAISKYAHTHMNIKMISTFCFLKCKCILQRRLSNAAKKAMDKIPTKTIKPSDLESIFEGELAECCAVCIEPFKTSDVVRILPCK